MADYTAVQKALSDGASPAMLCATCPWDRNCITPPVITRGEIDAKVAEATAEDRKRAEAEMAAGRDPGMPTGSLLTVLTYAGKDTAAQVCPVFALRLGSSNGRKIADAIQASMQQWDDES